MRSLAILALAFLFSSCTYTITLVHTEGTATDVVDDTSSAKADVSPNLTIPASVIP